MGAFLDTAAVMRNLGLVECVDTLGHLAGGLGVPVGLALPFAPDWRWQRERPDTPWYPSMRLFRQPRVGDCDSVFADLAAELHCHATRLAVPAEVETAPKKEQAFLGVAAARRLRNLGAACRSMAGGNSITGNTLPVGVSVLMASWFPAYLREAGFRNQSQSLYPASVLLLDALAAGESWKLTTKPQISARSASRKPE